MTHDLFDAHADVKGWSEPRTLWTCADPNRKHDRFDASDASPRVRNYIRKRFLKYQGRHGDLRVMEKTPSNVLRIPYVRAIFPESRLLYLMREPLANLSSTDLKWNNKPINRRRAWQRIRETPVSQLHFYVGRFVADQVRIRLLGLDRVSIWGVRYPGIYDDLEHLTIEEIIARQWVACVQQAEEDLTDVDPELVLRLRYEDFVEDPVAHFERICEHFGLPMTRDYAEYIRQTVDPGRRTKWKRLDADIVRRCVPIFREEMERQGYALPQEIAAIMAEAEESSTAA